MRSDNLGVLFYDDPLPYAALGASFDLGLIAEYGAAAGEALFCADVTRDPYERAGLSEDGLAAAVMTRAYLSRRVNTVAYTERDNPCMDYRAAREVWLRPFGEKFNGIIPPDTVNGAPFGEFAPAAATVKDKTVYRNFYDGGTDYFPQPAAKDASHLALRLAAASTVLLKNDGLLPVDGAAWLGTAEYKEKKYLALKRDRFSPRAMFRVARKVSGARAAVIALDTAGGLTRAQTELVRYTAKHAPTAVVLLGAEAVELPFADEVRAIIYAPAPDAVRCMEDIVSGRLQPAGRLPFTWADRGAYPARNPKGNRPNLFYESVYNGYRYFGAAGVRPLFGFGTGENYIATEYSSLRLTVTDEDLLVSFTVANLTGAAGTETVFVYTDGDDERAYGLGRRLAGFIKITLGQNETRSAGIKIAIKDLMIPDAAGDFLPNGKYGVTVENGSGPKLYGTVKLGRKCKPAFTADVIPSYYRGAGGLHILGADVQKLTGVPLYGDSFSPDWDAVRRKYGVCADNAAFSRKAAGISREQYSRL